VRNCRDGSVEALFAGSEDVVADLIARCRRGPSTARVDAVTEEPASLESAQFAASRRAFLGAADGVGGSGKGWSI